MNSIDSFINYIQHQKRYSQHTVKSYRKDLHQLRTYLRNQYNQEELNTALQKQ